MWGGFFSGISYFLIIYRLKFCFIFRKFSWIVSLNIFPILIHSPLAFLLLFSSNGMKVMHVGSYWSSIYKTYSLYSTKVFIHVYCIFSCSSLSFAPFPLLCFPQYFFFMLLSAWSSFPGLFFNFLLKLSFWGLVCAFFWSLVSLFVILHYREKQTHWAFVIQCYLFSFHLFCHNFHLLYDNTFLANVHLFVWHFSFYHVFLTTLYQFYFKFRILYK